MTHIVEKLKNRIDELLPPALGKSPEKLFILDAPDHENVGDQAILLGELAFLRRNFPETRLGIASFLTYNPALDKAIESADVIAIHGGGNFGDIWPSHHQFRLHVFRRFADKKIIQFPQSIHFSDPDILEETRRVIGACKNFTLVVRDTNSYAYASKHFDCHILLSPDMAFSLGRIVPPAPHKDFYCLLRTDKEVLEEKKEKLSVAFTSAGASYEIGDWLQLGPKLFNPHPYMRKLSKTPLRGWVAKAGLAGFESFAQKRMDYGISLLSRGRTVVTDRLHGHIITTLLDKPHYVFDSYDGKVHSLHSTWLTEDKNSHLVDKVDDFVEILSTAKNVSDI